jgi:large subunit ribosomal protein L25
MKTFEISGQVRDQVGATQAKATRHNGMVPAVMYGEGENLHFDVPTLVLEKLLSSSDTHLIKVDLQGKTHTAVLREVQYHTVSDEIIHIDLYAVKENKPFEVSLPILFQGTSKGVLAGGTLVKKLRSLKVVGTIETLPERVTVDISNLELGKTIKVKDISVEGITIRTASSAAIVTIDIPRSLRGDKAPEATPGKK